MRTFTAITLTGFTERPIASWEERTVFLRGEPTDARLRPLERFRQRVEPGLRIIGVMQIDACDLPSAKIGMGFDG